jgi:ferric-dicitrate binding protein FerR (iron transport regulator)
MKQELWDIMAKKFNNEPLTAEETEKLELLPDEKENCLILSEAQASWEKTHLYFKLKKIDTQQAWEKVKKTTEKPKNDHRMIYLLSSVAAIALILLVTKFFISIPDSRQPKTIERVTASNDESRPEVLLADGTTITLNRGTKLVYPEYFSDTVRKVSLSGEAFFNVAPNPDVPFVIETQGAEIKVLGTSFNVSSIEGTETTEVLVRSGSVALNGYETLNRIGSKTVVLFSGEMGTFNNKTGHISKDISFSENRLAWYTRKLKFESEPLSDVLDALSHTYNIRFQLEGNVKTDLALSASFERQDPEYILEVVALTLGLKIEKQDESLYLIKIK